jgi:hypothetical protein
MTPRNATHALLIALFTVVMLRTVSEIAEAPQLEWDMLAYMGLALAWENGDPQIIHQGTYEAARRELNPKRFRRLTGTGVRAVRFENPGAFYEHLAFYRSRVLYTFPVYLLHRAGAPLSGATWWISLASYAALSVLLLVWCARHLPLPVAVPVALGLAHAPPLVEIARQSTPDALYALVTAGAIYVWIEQRAPRVAATILVASLLVRGDAIIFQVFLIGALMALGPPEVRLRRAFAATWLAVSVVVYTTASFASGYYGWWPLFSIGFLGKSAYPSMLPTSPDWAVYAEVLGAQLSGITSSVLFVYGAFALLGIAYWRRFRPNSIEATHCAAVLIAFLPTYAARYLLFPELWVRFYVPFTVLVPVLLLTLVAGSERERGA